MVLGVAVVIASVLGSGMIVPQIARLRRLGTSTGVSRLWVGVSLAANGWWVAYGLATGALGMVPVSIGSGLLYLVIVRQLVRLDGGGVAIGVVGGALAMSVAPTLGLVLFGWTAAGLTVGLTYAVQFTPAAAQVIRTRNPVGVSPATWVMALVEAVIWLGYGAAIGDAPIAVGGGGGSVMAAVICVRMATVRVAVRPRTTYALSSTAQAG